MDNNNEHENGERRNSNTEYVPTKCRITKPPPPKPATNPLQFIRTAPCPLFQKAHEQIKKVEEIKKERKEVREEAEDWQANLDNWKSCRRKRQEHIIERVVEVKKLEQEEHERHRRKSKTFNEMIEDRSRGRHKFSIPIYDDDSNDLSDYGIGSSSSKTNSIKDVDTDDSSSILDEKDQHNSLDSPCSKDNLSASNQSQSEDETNNVKKDKILMPPPPSTNRTIVVASQSSSISSFYNTSNASKSSIATTASNDTKLSYDSSKTENTTEQYTYEGAIQDYRSRIRSKIHVDESIFTKSEQEYSKSKEFSEAQTALPKGEIGKRKELFEVEKPVEINNYESHTSRRLSEDFVNTQSIKQRLQSLEKCTDQPLKAVDKGEVSIVKQRLQNFSSKQSEVDSRNNNNFKVPVRISNYLVSKSDSNSSLETKNNTDIISNNNNNNNNSNIHTLADWKKKDAQAHDRCSSPDTDLYMDKLNMFSKDLDNLMYGKSSSLEDYSVSNASYPASTSSAELIGLSSDREDSGIHTADVSCSVSQSDELVEDAELASTTIPSCIEKLQKEESRKVLINNDNSNNNNFVVDNNKSGEQQPDSSPAKNVVVVTKRNTAELLDLTIKLLESLKLDASENLYAAKIVPLQIVKPTVKPPTEPADKIPENVAENPERAPSRPLCEKTPKLIENVSSSFDKNPPPADKLYENVVFDRSPVPAVKENQAKLYENVVFGTSASVPFLTAADAAFPLAPPKLKEPPKVKPPPPPPPTEEDPSSNADLPPENMKRLNSTKRIKREIHIKRSSFLGLDEPTVEQMYPEIGLTKPPDVNQFLQKESKMEKSLFKKAQEGIVGGLNKVESHDSGLDIDRGRLSSDTWCSSIGDSSTSTPERQDSEHTNSITSEEDEITKKEREIIEMVEKEEKSRDNVEFATNTNTTSGISYDTNPTNGVISKNKQNSILNEPPYLGSESFNNPYFPKEPSSYLDDQDSEVLKVEQELRQLEREEFERQRENILFQESRAKARLQNNRHSLENIFDDDRFTSPYQEGADYRQSMPELQHIPLEYRKSLPDVPNAYNIYRPAPELDVQYRKSMPNIQHAYHKSVPEYRRKSSMPQESEMKMSVDHRKSMPELLQQRPSAFRSPPPSAVKRQLPIMPGKPLRPLTKEQKERYLALNSGLPLPGGATQQQNSTGQNGGGGGSSSVKHRQLSRHSLQALSAVPKNRHLPVDNWIQPRANPDAKSYNQHWLYQEAELRRISEQKSAAAVNRNWQQSSRQDKPLPDSVIQSLTQRVQNRVEMNEQRNSHQPIRRPDASPIRDGIQSQPQQQHPQQHSYLGHNQTMGHALPMPIPPYSPPMVMEESQDRILSVSGKKKCSYCSNELGRGAAMIIESLCLFYHMECFKCCVCHMQLGDGLMGTDVRVRNQKLHCHNCYSSDDGVKFSCV